MGANMMLVTAAAPHLADDSALPADDAERLRILEQIGVTRVHKVPESKIIAVLGWCEIEFAGNEAVIDGLNGDPEVDVTDEMIRNAREGLATGGSALSRSELFRLLLVGHQRRRAMMRPSQPLTPTV